MSATNVFPTLTRTPLQLTKELSPITNSPLTFKKIHPYSLGIHPYPLEIHPYP